MRRAQPTRRERRRKAETPEGREPKGSLVAKGDAAGWRARRTPIHAREERAAKNWHKWFFCRRAIAFKKKNSKAQADVWSRLGGTHWLARLPELTVNHPLLYTLIK